MCPSADRGSWCCGFGAAAAPSLDLGLSWREFRHVEAGLREFDAWLAHPPRHPAPQPRRRPAQPARGRPGGRRRAHRHRAQVHRRARARGGLRDHGQPARQRHRPAGRRSGSSARVLRRAWRTVGQRRRRGAPLRPARPAHRPDGHHRHRRRGRGDPPGHRRWWRPARPGPTATRGSSRIPRRFDVARENARDHVSFSAGRHYCLGAALARMEGEVGLRTLFERHPDLQLEPGATRRTTRILRGYGTSP